MAETPDNYHKHKCAFCGVGVWEHHDVNDTGHNSSPGAHECPVCHRCNWGLGIYNGPDVPKVRNGLDPGPAVVGSIHPDQSAVQTS